MSFHELVVDAVQLCRQGNHEHGQDLQGEFALGRLLRLGADLALDEVSLGEISPVQWQAVFWHTESVGMSGDSRRDSSNASVKLSVKRWLCLRVKASLPLVCQRCLGPQMETLWLDRKFRLVDSEAQAEALLDQQAESEDSEQEVEPLVALEKFDLLSLIEDELILALPAVPVHAQCPENDVRKKAHQLAESAKQIDELDAASESKRDDARVKGAFAALQSLKKTTH